MLDVRYYRKKKENAKRGGGEKEGKGECQETGRKEWNKKDMVSEKRSEAKENRNKVIDEDDVNKMPKRKNIQKKQEEKGEEGDILLTESQ